MANNGNGASGNRGGNNRLWLPHSLSTLSFYLVIKEGSMTGIESSSSGSSIKQTRDDNL